MTFLAPTAGIVAAALALPVLLGMYFLKLRRRPVRVSSTLLWEQAVRDVQVNVPIRWLKPAWSLLLQLLALACLLLAVARPAQQSDGPAGPVVILIDRSASMSALDGVPAPGQPATSRLDEAKRRALETLDRLRREGHRQPVLVAQFAAAAQSLTPFTTDRATLREAVESITPTDQPDDLAAAVTLVQTIVKSHIDAAEQPDRPAPVTVLIYSDGNLAEPERPLVAAGLLVRLERVGASIGPETPPANRGIVALAARRDHEDPVSVRLLARVLNAGAEAVEVPVRLSLNGEDIALRTVSVPPASTDARGRKVGGEAALSLSFPSPGRGVAVLSLTGRDALAADDSAAVVLAAPSRPRVLVIGPGGATPVDPFLLSALRALDLATLDTGDPGSLAALEAGGGLRERYDLVILDRATPRTRPSVPSLSIGAGLPFETSPIGLEPGASSTRALTWERGHPVLRYVPLDGVVFDEPLRITLPEAWPAGTSARALALGRDGPLIALIEESGGNLRRLIFGFELARSTLGTSIALPILLTQAIDFLTLRGEATVGKASRTTEPVELIPAGEATRERRLELVGPITLAAAAQPGTDRVWVGPIERAGLYRVSGVVPTQELVAVNMDQPTESLAGVSDTLPLTASSPASAGAGGQGPVREWWPQLLMAALALLVLEWFVFARSMRV
jgi:hypothetical protein